MDQLTNGPTPRRAGPEATALYRIAEGLALAGGALLIAAALLVCASVALRFATTSAIPGDYESVQMAMALVAFAFLPYCQVRAGHIFVETFTTMLPAGARIALDALWDLVTAAFAGLIAWRLAVGGLETNANGTTTMVIGLPVGWAILAATAMAVVWCAAAIASALGRRRGRT